MGYTDMNIYT